MLGESGEPFAFVGKHVARANRLELRQSAAVEFRDDLRFEVGIKGDTAIVVGEHGVQVGASLGGIMVEPQAKKVKQWIVELMHRRRVRFEDVRPWQ